MLCSAGIFATTIQAQDFKDTEGDRLVGRKTLPIVAPELARPTLMLALLAWSVGLSSLWSLSTKVSLAYIILAVAVGLRYITFNSIKADQRSFYLYNVSVLISSHSTSYLASVLKVWLSASHALPAYFRFVAQAPVF